MPRQILTGLSNLTLAPFPLLVFSQQSSHSDPLKTRPGHFLTMLNILQRLPVSGKVKPEVFLTNKKAKSWPTIVSLTSLLFGGHTGPAST